MPDRGATFAECLNVLGEYAGALRGAWGSIDGRSEQRALLFLRDAMHEAHQEGNAGVGVHRLRNELGVCPQGGGHWTEHCDESCSASRQDEGDQNG